MIGHFLFPRFPRGAITLLIALIASFSTLTIVQRCTATHTTIIHTDLPARAIAQAGHGTIIASARLTLPRRDTVIVHDTIATAGTITRTASFHDSTFAGFVTGAVTAPPGAAPLGITYHITRPVFDPTISFITTASHPLAVVSWRGEQIALDHVVIPPAPSPPRWTRTVDLTYNPILKTASLAGTFGVRLPAGMDVVASVAHPLSLTSLGALPTPAITLRRRL